MKFEELVIKTRKSQPNWIPPARLLALDPGETIGYALFIEGKLVDCGQEIAKECPAQAIMNVFDRVKPTQIIAEDYRVYGHKSDSHKWSSLFTPRLLGMIELLCYQREINLDYQMAATVKQFCSLARLKQWGMYESSRRHAMDAIKHGTYYLLFHDRMTGRVGN